MAPSEEIGKTTQGSIKTQKVTIASTSISLLEPSPSKEIFLELKIPTDVSLLSGTGVSVTPEIRITLKKEYEITRNVASKKVSNY